MIGRRTVGADADSKVDVIELPQGPPGRVGADGAPGSDAEQHVFFGPDAPTVPGPWVWYETDPDAGLVDIHVEAPDA